MKKTMAAVIVSTILIATLLFIFAAPGMAITEQVATPWGTFAGSGAGASNTGGYNAFFGYNAGYANDDGGLNTFVGAKSGFENTSGQWNTFVGYSAGGMNTTGNYNTFVGWYAGLGNISSSWNTYIGNCAGCNNNGWSNVFIGNMAGFYETIGANMLYISNSITSTPLIYGEFDNNLVRINGRLVFPSDERLKKNIEPLKSSLDKVMRLKGVSFEWKEEGSRGKGRNIGLIAQDVETIIPELVFTNRKGDKALSYDKFVPELVEAIKEQQALIDEQKETLASKSLTVDSQQKALVEQNAIINDLAGQLAALRADVNKLKSKDITAQK